MQEVVRRPHPGPPQSQIDQFDSMVQGLRDSADLLERLGRDIAVRSILVDVLADLLNGSMATVRFVASALLGLVPARVCLGALDPGKRSGRREGTGEPRLQRRVR